MMDASAFATAKEHEASLEEMYLSLPQDVKKLVRVRGNSQIIEGPYLHTMADSMGARDRQIPGVDTRVGRACCCCCDQPAVDRAVLVVDEGVGRDGCDGQGCL